MSRRLAISIGLHRYSHQLISETKEFVVNVVGQSFMHAVEVCGNASGADADKFALAGIRLEDSHRVRPSRIAGALGYLECRLAERTAAGDHSLFVANVLCAEAQEDSFPGIWDTEQGDVLLCRQRDQFGKCRASERYITQSTRQ